MVMRDKTIAALPIQFTYATRRGILKHTGACLWPYCEMHLQ
jgi:hypothetical protein